MGASAPGPPGMEASARVEKPGLGRWSSEGPVEAGGWGEVKGGNAGSGVFGSPGTAGDAY